APNRGGNLAPGGKIETPRIGKRRSTRAFEGTRLVVEEPANLVALDGTGRSIHDPELELNVEGRARANVAEYHARRLFILRPFRIGSYERERGTEPSFAAAPGFGDLREKPDASKTGTEHKQEVEDRVEAIARRDAIRPYPERSCTC